MDASSDWCRAVLRKRRRRSITLPTTCSKKSLEIRFSCRPGKIDYVNEDAAGFELEKPKPPPDAGPRDAATVDAGPIVNCATPHVAGDLRIVEMMIASQSGPNDGAEWFEVLNTRKCRANLRGVAFASPRGAAESNTVTVGGDMFLNPGAAVVIASDPDLKVNFLPQTSPFSESARRAQERR